MKVKGGKIEIDWYREEDGIEVGYRVFAEVEDFDPGRISGPPEDCYPPEGGGVDVIRIEKTGDAPGRLLDFNTLPEDEQHAICEQVAAEHGVG